MYLSPFGDAGLLGTHEVTLTLTLTLIPPLRFTLPYQPQGWGISHPAPRGHAEPLGLEHSRIMAYSTVGAATVRRIPPLPTFFK